MAAIWKMAISLEAMNERGKGTMAEFLEMRFTEYGDDYLVATMPVEDRTRQPIGLLHGGASLALAEQVGSMGANFCVDQRYRYCVGLAINANHLRPVRQGLVTAIGRPLHLGRTTQVWEIRIHANRQRLICLSRLTMAVIDRNGARAATAPAGSEGLAG